MVAPFKMSCEKHDGAERWRMMQWDGKKFQIVSDWVPAPDPAFIRKLIEKSAAKYAKENNITPRAAPDWQRQAIKRCRGVGFSAPASIDSAQGDCHECAAARCERTAAAEAAAQPILAVKNIEVIYDHVILVLRGVSLEVPQGRIVALLGGNGAGKSTTLKSISTLLASERGAVTKGSIEFRGQRIDKLTPGDLVGMGMVQVMEGRHCFAHLTVEENLITGAYTRPIKGAQLQEALDRVYAYFPRLKVRRTSLAGYTSGGEQQMTAIGRAMMAKPNMLLLDEPSMGLAPQIVAEIFEIVRNLNQKEGVSILLAEQNTNVALKYADYGYILESGRIMMDGPAKALAENKDVKEFYLGMSSEGRKSFRDMKSYRRRKRWL